MSLPVSRDETLTPNAIVKSALLNSIQDSIVVLNTATRVFTISPRIFLSTLNPSNWSRNITNGGIQRDAATTVAETIDLDALRIEEGMTITIDVKCFGSAAVGLSFNLTYRDNTALGASTSVGSANTSGSPAADQTLNLCTNHVVVANASYNLNCAIVNAGSAGARSIYWVKVSSHR